MITPIPFRVYHLCLVLLLGWCTLPKSLLAQGVTTTFPTESERMIAYQARIDTLLNFYADQIPASDLTRGGYLHLAARLIRGRDLDWVLARLDTLMLQPSGDMFWMYPFITVTYAGRDRLPEEYRRRMREMWRTYTPYRGDTENHWAMYYTALYLITQMYPDEPGERWFTGKSSSENFEEAREYLLSWMDLTTTIGQGEYDSPDYFGVYIVPMAQLYAWAEDPAMKQRAAMMLDYLIADFAAESLNGLYTGAHSRTYPAQVQEQWNTSSTGIAWLLFGNTPFLPRGEAAILAMSGYEPPEILYRIATDRTQPYVHQERKRTRHRIRFSDERNAPVYKTTYMRPEYAVGTSQGGLLQPIQQHTWDITWAVDDPRGVHNTLFTVHPYADSYELGMYFPEELKLLTDHVVKSKGTYNSADKWTGASPYEQVFQDEDAVVVLYNIPPETRFPHIGAFFSKDLKTREVDKSGWIFAQGGDALIAYYPLASYEWRTEADGTMRLHSDKLMNGAVVQVASASDYPDIETFKAAVRALPLESSIQDRPSVRFTNLRGREMAFTFGGTPRLDGQPVDYESWRLFDGPFMQSEVGSRKLELRHGPMRRILDFNTLTITDRVEE